MKTRIQKIIAILTVDHVGRRFWGCPGTTGPAHIVEEKSETSKITVTLKTAGMLRRLGYVWQGPLIIMREEVMMIDAPDVMASRVFVMSREPEGLEP